MTLTSLPLTLIRTQLYHLSLFHINCMIVLRCDLLLASGHAADRRQNCIPHSFSLKVRLPYVARRIVLRSRAGLSLDVLAELQDSRKYGYGTVVPTSRVVIGYVAIMRQWCNNRQGHCTVIVWQSCVI